MKKIISSSLMLRVAMWNNNYSSRERLSIESFTEFFGERMGRHYYEKWGYPAECKFMKMMSYYGTDSKDAETFCQMVTAQMLKYEQRVGYVAPSSNDTINELSCKLALYDLVERYNLRPTEVLNEQTNSYIEEYQDVFNELYDIYYTKLNQL
ncbi:MAG: hypothetical protein R3Y66_08710 [Rikenellaceae bacterium]